MRSCFFGVLVTVAGGKRFCGGLVTDVEVDGLSNDRPTEGVEAGTSATLPERLS